MAEMKTMLSVVEGVISGKISAGEMVLNDYRLTIEDIEGGHRLTAIRGSEVQSIDIMDGGEGFSPTIEVSKVLIQDTATGDAHKFINGYDIKITDKNGEETIRLQDGFTGATGKTGASSHIKLTQQEDGVLIIATNTPSEANAVPTVAQAFVENGKDGKPGVIISTEKPDDPDVKVWIDPEGKVGRDYATTDDIDKVTAEILDVRQLKKSTNILDKSKLQLGTLNSKGVFVADEAANYLCTDYYIPVTPGQYIHAVIHNTNEYVEGTIQRISQFNADKVFVSNIKAATYLVPDGVEFVKLQITTSWFVYNRVMITITDSAEIPPFEFYYEPYVKIPGVNTVVHINAADGLDAYYDKMLFAFSAGDCDVYISGGDIVYTNEFVDKIRADKKRGVPIGGNCRYYFETGTRIICEYTGENATDVKGFFSPLDSWSLSSSFEIYNLELISKNTVYALHDEVDGEEDFCKHVYKNCYITLDNSALGENGNSLSKCIGGGLGLHSEIIIENCVFDATNPLNTEGEDVSYHKANDQDFTDANIIISGCYFKGMLRIDMTYDVLPDIVPRVIACGNSARGIDLYQCNAKAWGNEIRDV